MLAKLPARVGAFSYRSLAPAARLGDESLKAEGAPETPKRRHGHLVIVGCKDLSRSELYSYTTNFLIYEGVAVCDLENLIGAMYLKELESMRSMSVPSFSSKHIPVDTRLAPTLDDPSPTPSSMGGN